MIEAEGRAAQVVSCNRNLSTFFDQRRPQGQAQWLYVDGGNVAHLEILIEDLKWYNISDSMHQRFPDRSV